MLLEDDKTSNDKHYTTSHYNNTNTNSTAQYHKTQQVYRGALLPLHNTLHNTLHHHWGTHYRSGSGTECMDITTTTV
jgi:hypothetical protein